MLVEQTTLQPDLTESAVNVEPDETQSAKTAANKIKPISRSEKAMRGAVQARGIYPPTVRLGCYFLAITFY